MMMMSDRGVMVAHARDSVDHNALWLLLRSLGIPLKLVDIFKDTADTGHVNLILYSDQCYALHWTDNSANTERPVTESRQ